VTGTLGKLRAVYDQGYDTLQKALMVALEDDGLNPKIKRSGDNILSIQLNIGGGEQCLLTVHKNPINTLLGGSR
jgi:hypothetical protein